MVCWCGRAAYGNSIHTHTCTYIHYTHNAPAESVFGFTQGQGGHFLIDLSVKAGAQPLWVTSGARGGDEGRAKVHECLQARRWCRRKRWMLEFKE